MTNNFKFSVVMAVYNTAEYVNEAIDSIINQTLDFEDNIQIILVNDGSTDESLDILKKYQSQFPDNILVITQDNQGASVARNNGLKHVKGQFVSFLDSDDYLSHNAFEEVLKFFEKYYDSVDVVALPFVPFGRHSSEHMLHYKFSETRLIDLTLEPNNPQLSAASSVVKFESIGDIEFPNTIASEDANFLNKILLKKKNLGVVTEAKYNYRKRDDVSSSLDNASNNERYYTDRLKNHFLNLIDYCLEKEGYVPEFVQYMMIYDLYYLIKDTNLEIFEEHINKAEFMDCLDQIFKYIDADVIWSNHNIKHNLLKKFLRYIKFKKMHVNPKKGTILLTGKKQIDKLSYHVFWLEIVKIKDCFFNISGYLNSLFNSNHISISAIKENSNGVTKIIADPVFYTNRKNKSFIGIDWLYKYNFDLKIPIENDEDSIIKICVNYHIDGDVSNFEEKNIVSHFLKIGFKNRSDISKISNYFVKDNHIVNFEDNKFFIKPYDFNDMEILEKQVQKNLLNEKKFSFYFLRVLYLFFYTHTSFFSKPIYLFIDRIDEANDNSFYLFKHAINQDDGIKKYFVLSKNCEDYKKVKKIGNVISKNSLKYKLMFMFADKIISTHPYLSEINPFYDSSSKTDNRPYVSGLTNADLYFLQHGVMKEDLSHWISKSNYNFSLLLTSSELEKESFCGEGYGFDREIIQDLGLPRFDNLKKSKSKNILIAPSWRNYLKGNKTKFIESEYFQSLNNLLSNQKFVDIADKYGFNIIFKPHPELERYIDNSNERYVDLFDCLDEIDVKISVNYSNLFNESQILITDFSSVFFDFAYLKKPVIYYQPNEDYHYKKSYFDYETMGFGDVIVVDDDLLQKIDFYLKNGCVMEDKYKNNVDKFFKYNDNKNCERVYNWIKKH